jgi:hypothetical protein
MGPRAVSHSDHRTASDLTPLSPAFFHMLLSLGADERHGYAIKREIAARTKGKLKLGPVCCMDRSTRCWSWG